MMNYSGLEEYLRFTPYDSSFSKAIVPEGEDNEHFFRKELLVPYPETSFRAYRKKIISLIRNVNKHMIILSGRSGSGKTTFLHYLDYEEQDLYGAYYSADFINLIQTPALSESETLIHASIEDRILSLMDQSVVDQITEMIDSASDENGSDWKSNLFYESGQYDDHDRFVNFLGRCCFGFSNRVVKEFLGETKSITDIIAFYLITAIIKNCLAKDKYSVFVFDNLDDLQYSYFSPFILNQLYDAFSKAQSFFENYYPQYKFLEKCTFVIAIRSSNLVYIGAAQQTERRNAVTRYIEFGSDIRVGLQDIFSRRINCFVRNRPPQSDSLDWLKQLTTLEKNYLRDVIGRLFNYDYRVAIAALSSMSRWKTPDIDFSVFEKNRECSVGSKGIILFGILVSRLANSQSRFLIYANNDLARDSCNMQRMNFSLLSNKTSEDVDFRHLSENDLYADGSKTVPLLSFTETIVKWYKDEAETIYNELFVAEEQNYAIPASLAGDVVNQYVKSENGRATLKGIKDFVFKQYQRSPLQLSSVNIVVNPLCSVYARHVFIHYEYFNLLCYLDSGLSGKHPREFRPLYLLQDKTDIISCLKDVLRMASKIIWNSDRHLCKQCEHFKKGSCSNTTDNPCANVIYKMSQDGFLINDSLYASRVISAHINYLDSFRHYLWLRDVKKGGGVRYDIQKVIVDTIADYCKLFKGRMVTDHKVKTTIKAIEQNLAYYQMSSDRSEWIAIDNSQ